MASSEVVFEGGLVNMRVDRLRDGDSTFERDVVVHPGAVAVVALDDADRILVVTQYRHAVGERLIEIPAGLLDVPGEERLDAAKRELREEGLVQAAEWRELFTLIPQPGVSTERVAVYLARGITAADVPGGFAAEHEEATMTRHWVPLSELVEAVLDGRVSNALTVAGSLAAWRLLHGSSG